MVLEQGMEMWHNYNSFTFDLFFEGREILLLATIDIVWFEKQM